MNVTNRKVADLVPYAKNAKVHDKRQISNVAESIKQFGFVQPVVCDKDGVIVIGHCRVLAAKKLGMEEVPCVCVEDLTPEQVNALRLIDNKSAESEWDMMLLSEELPGIDLNGFDFDWGLEIEKEVVEVPAPAVDHENEPTSKLGDRFQLGNHFLVCGDSTKLEDVEYLVGGQEMDMLLTDPPYNVNYKGVAGTIKNDNMEDSAFRCFLTDAFVCAFAVLKKGASFHIWHADNEGYNFRGAAQDAGLVLRQVLIWVKNTNSLGRQDFQWQHEPCLAGEPLSEPVDLDEESGYDPCLYGWKDGATHRWYKQRREKTVLYFDKPQRSKDHPTMKPIKLFDYEMKCNTQPGDNVLDLFGGSGTAIMAAEQNGRNAYVMEYDPRYCDVIIRRWEEFTGEKAILLSQKGASVEDV